MYLIAFTLVILSTAFLGGCEFFENLVSEESAPQQSSVVPPASQSTPLGDLGYVVLSDGDYASFRIMPGFQAEEIVGTGNTGGPRLASEATGVSTTETGECRGYIDTLPDHQLDLTADFEFLSIAAKTEGESSLVIFGPNAEIWCVTGANPSISGFYDQGTYDVYVGNLKRDIGPRYELIITELQPSTL